MRKPAYSRNNASILRVLACHEKTCFFTLKCNKFAPFWRVTRKPAFPRNNAAYLQIFGVSRENLPFYIIMHQNWWRAKKVQICCILSGKAGFLLTRQKDANWLHYYVEKQVFSWRAKKVQICCFYKWKSRFSRDAPKRCKFVAFLSGKQIYSWRAKKVQICCIITFRSRFFSWRDRKQCVHLMHYYVS